MVYFILFSGILNTSNTGEKRQMAAIKSIKGQFHVTATEKKAIKSGLEQNLSRFGTSRKIYQVLSSTEKTVQVEIITKCTDDWGRAYNQKEKVEVTYA